MKPTYKIFLFLFCLAVFSCQDINEVEKPDDLIDEEKMTDILYDLALIDASMSAARRGPSGKELAPKKYIFEKYGIDSVQLARSNAYYLQHFDINLRIYENVRDRLQARKKVLDSLEFLQDSLRREKLKKSKSGKPDSMETSDIQKKANLQKKLPLFVPVPVKDSVN